MTRRGTLLRTTILLHTTGAHAPSNAQKNSDITKEEIEAKLTGQISTHSHAPSGGLTMDEISDGDDYVKTENNFTDDFALKLSGIEEGANAYEISKEDVESVLTGEIESHSHAGGGGLSQAQVLTRML